MAVAMRGGRLANRLLVVIGDQHAGIGRLRLGFLFGLEARGLCGFAARGLDRFGATTIVGGQLFLLGQVALLGFLELAQDLGALVGRARLGRLDQRDLLAHDDVHRRAVLAATDGELLLAAAIQRDLLRRFAYLGDRLGLAVGTLEEAEQLDFLDAGHDLVGAAEAHAGLGQLLQQLLDRRVHQFGQLADGGLLRHSVSGSVWPPRGIPRWRL
jgi:hypothetical protein